MEFSLPQLPTSGQHSHAKPACTGPPDSLPWQAASQCLWELLLNIHPSNQGHMAPVTKTHTSPSLAANSDTMVVLLKSVGPFLACLLSRQLMGASENHCKAQLYPTKGTGLLQQKPDLAPPQLPASSLHGHTALARGPLEPTSPADSSWAPL